ncbi:MAG: hypothetical protein E4H16_00880 [Candidatus Atribacteria bacterium]|nr:MAG: hypothetical protein E4H16_00880 [Candidatus Atribacteria bacterium]
MKKTLLVAFAILFSLIPSSYALETDTHELINEYIGTHTLNGFSLDSYLKDQLNIEEGIEELLESKQVWKCLKIGGTYEDNPNWHTIWERSVNHFHNPLTDEGYSGIWGISWLSGVSSIQWSQKSVGMQSPGGHYSWHDVREYFYNALTAPTKSERDENFAQTFRGLGQLMHLVQDLSVPAHTRADGHIMYNYETWARDNANINNISTYAPEYFDSSALETPNSPADVPFANLFDTNQYAGSNPNITLQSNIGLSEYTNANFFSEDTIFKIFPYPSRDSVSLNDIAIPDPRYPSGDVLRKYFNKVSDGDTGYRVASVSFLRGFEDECAPFCSEWFYENAALDDEVYGDYATRLIPKAVGYSADLLYYFFRGKLKAELGDGEIQITNKSEETMHEGTFELYYDNEQGQRQAISISSGAEVASLDPDEDTTITFDPPSDFGEDKHYIIVYRGALGNETDAVVVGFKHDPKTLGFSLKLTRGDGVPADESLNTWIYVLDSTMSYLTITDPVYDPETLSWTFNLVYPEDADPLGYYVYYGCDDCLNVQYPYRYKDSEWNNPADLVPVGSYEDVLPFYQATFGDYVPGTGHFASETVYTTYFPVDTISRTINIKSSIPLIATLGTLFPEGMWLTVQYVPAAITSVGVGTLSCFGGTIPESWGGGLTELEIPISPGVGGADYNLTFTIDVPVDWWREAYEDWAYFLHLSLNINCIKVSISPA